MGITELIAKIQNSDWEEGKTVASQISDEIKKLNSQTKEELAQSKKEVETILAVVEAEGSDHAEKLTDAGKKIAGLQQRNQELQENLSTRESELKDIKQNALFSEVGQKSGVKTNVLKTLISDEDKLEVNGDKVTVNGTEIKEWAKANQADFYPALFPKTYADIDLPGGGSKGDSALPNGGSKGDPSSDKKKPAVLRHSKEDIRKSFAYYSA